MALTTRTNWTKPATQHINKELITDSDYLASTTKPCGTKRIVVHTDFLDDSHMMAVEFFKSLQEKMTSIKANCKELGIQHDLEVRTEQDYANAYTVYKVLLTATPEDLAVYKLSGGI